MRSFFLIFVIGVVIGVGNNSKGFSQSKNLSDKIVAIDNIKQDSAKRLILLYNLKSVAEKNKLVRDTSYILILIKIANYENNLHNDIPKAINYTNQALQTLQSLNISDLNLLANVYYNLGVLYYLSRIYNQAKFFFDKTIELGASGNLQGFYLGAMFYGAAVDDLLGDYEKVEKKSQIAMIETEITHDTLNYNRLLYLHAHSLMFQNQLRLALIESKQLEKRAILSNDYYMLANAYNLQATIYNNYHNYTAAEQFYKAALKIRPYSSEYESITIDCNDLALFYFHSLQNYKQAEFYYKKAITYAKRCPISRQSKLFPMLYCNLGDVSAKAKDFEKAITYYNQALSTINLKTSDFLLSNPTIKQLSTVGEKTQILSILTSKCRLLLALFQKGKNNSYLQQCINTAITTDSLIAQMRHEQTGDKSKLYWRNETHEFFSKAMEACFLSENVDKAFFFMEKSRSVLLNDKLNELISSLSYLPLQKILTENRLVNDIAELQTRLEYFSASSQDYAYTLKKLDSKHNELNHYIKSLEKEYPQYYQYKYADDVPAITDVRQYLKYNNQSLVYYFTVDSAIYILGITKNRTSFIKVPATSFDSRQLVQFINLCSNRRESNSSYKVYSTLSQNIYQKIFEPLQLPPGNVTVCTDNFFIPFDALCSDSNGKKFLLYQYNFSYAYSARTLLKPFKSFAKSEGNFIGFAPVAFAPQLHVFPLNNSAPALQKLADCYSKSSVFKNRNATRYRFFQNASRYTIVTVFSHAQADTTDKEPVLYMQDSVIRLSELQKLKNPATQFVLLSACQTNTGKNATGEGVYSLARGFASAGIPSVSATLWNADEEATYSISTKFNEYLSEGMNKSEALQKAKVWYLQNSNLEHRLPFYWANMVLIGSSDSIVLSESNQNWLWLAVTIFAGIFIISFLIFRYKKKSSLKTEVADKVLSK